MVKISSCNFNLKIEMGDGKTLVREQIASEYLKSSIMDQKVPYESNASPLTIECIKDIQKKFTKEEFETYLKIRKAIRIKKRLEMLTVLEEFTKAQSDEIEINVEAAFEDLYQRAGLGYSYLKGRNRDFEASDDLYEFVVEFF
jgi:hypothetical protein